MTRLRNGSGGSAFSLGFAAGLAAAGGFAAATAPVFAAGGAVVLPSTGSAIFPLLDLSISIINRDYRQTKFPKTIFRYSFLYFRKHLPVKANSAFRAHLFPWFIFWTELCSFGIAGAGRSITARRGGQFSRRLWRARSSGLPALPRAAGAATQLRAEFFAARANQGGPLNPLETSQDAAFANSRRCTKRTGVHLESVVEHP